MGFQLSMPPINTHLPRQPPRVTLHSRTKHHGATPTLSPWYCLFSSAPYLQEQASPIMGGYPRHQPRREYMMRGGCASVLSCYRCLLLLTTHHHHRLLSPRSSPSPLSIHLTLASPAALVRWSPLPEGADLIYQPSPIKLPRNVIKPVCGPLLVGWGIRISSDGGWHCSAIAVVNPYMG